jgi:hypothetical protein
MPRKPSKGDEGSDAFVLNAFKEAVSMNDEATAAQKAFKARRELIASAFTNELTEEELAAFYKATKEANVKTAIMRFVRAAFIFGFRSGVLYKTDKR